MTERVTEWRPTEVEVRRIVEELRPLIRSFADRDRQRLASAAVAHR